MRQLSPDATRPPLESQSVENTMASNAAIEMALGTSVMASSSSPTVTEVVSTAVGDHDGSCEGFGEGGFVGNGDGCDEGLAVGRGLGFGDGFGVGVSEGDCVGGTLGPLVGTGEGLSVGRTLGSCVGEHVTPEKQTPSQPRSE
jgi:hypothetical protein